MFDQFISLPIRQPVGGGLFLVGTILMAYGLVRVFTNVFERVPPAESQMKASDAAGSGSRRIGRGDRRGRPIAIAVLLLIVAGGAFLRLEGISEKTLTHTEAIVPNIDLPADISWPPARHSLYDTFWWHFHSEGHPESYYLFMWFWTKLFGTGHTALRLPSALFGIGCIGLVYGIGALSYDRRVGLVSAALVAFSGFHIYWSQYARMYMMGCFLALVSTYALLHVVRNSEKRHWWEVIYVLSSCVAIYTQTFFWMVLAAQMLWVGFRMQGTSPGTRRTLALQQIVVILGASALAHIIYLGDDVTLPGPSLSFVTQYLSFGFLFQPDDLSIPMRSFSAVTSLLLLTLALVFIIRAPSPNLSDIRRSIREAPIPLRIVLPIACGSAMMVLGISVLAFRRQHVIALVAILPFLGLLVPSGYALLQSLNARCRTHLSPALAGVFVRIRTRLSMPVALAFIPAIGVLVLSFWTSMLAPRAFLMFVPYLLIVIAAGVVSLWHRRSLALVVGVILVLVHSAGIIHFRHYPTEERDYAGLGREMALHIEPDDLIFVVPKSWVTTPLFYYINHLNPAYVAENYAGAVASNPRARIWLLLFESARWGPYGTTNEEMREALEGFRPVKEVQALRGRAVLYSRNDL